MERPSNSFAPFFAERSLTAGTMQMSFGLTFQAASYKSLDGHDLPDSSFVTTANQFSGRGGAVRRRNAHDARLLFRNRQLLNLIHTNSLRRIQAS